MSTKYTVSYEGIWDIVIEINDKKLPKGLLAEINNFWSGEQQRLNNEGQSVVACVLKLIAQQAFRIQVEYECGTYGLIKKFSKEEGYPMLDGSYGIRIISVDTLSIDSESMEISPHE